MKYFKIVYEVSKEYNGKDFDDAMRKHEEDDLLVPDDINAEYIDVTRGYEIDAKTGIKLEDHI